MTIPVRETDVSRGNLKTAVIIVTDAEIILTAAVTTAGIQEKMTVLRSLHRQFRNRNQAEARQKIKKKIIKRKSIWKKISWAAEKIKTRNRYQS